VALVDGQIHRFAGGPARVVKVWGRIRELHEVPEVLDRAVPAPAVDVPHERRTVGRSENRCAATDVNGAGGITRVLVELSRGCRLHDLPREPALEADALTLDVCPGVLQQDQRVGISAEI